MVREDVTVNAAPSAPTESASAAAWPRVKLGEVCELSADGDWIESKDQALSGIRLIQTGNIGNGRFENKAEKSRFVSEDTFSRLHCTEIFSGDVLVSRLPDPVGRACKLPDIGQRMITAVDCTILRFKDVVDSDFFVLFSQSPDYRLQIGSFITGATRARISRKNLEQISIPLPPLSVQCEIVARLDAELAKADRMREEFLAIAENAGARFRAILAETFEGGEAGDSWSRKKLGEVCEIVSSRGHQIQQGEIRPVGKWPVVSQSENVIEGYTDDSTPIDCVPLVLFGDHTCCVKYIEQPFVVGADGTKLLKPIGVDTAYFFCFCRHAASRLADGRYRRHIADLISLEIPLPPLSVQREIVARLDAARAECDRAEALARKGAEECVGLRAALLKEAFE